MRRRKGTRYRPDRGLKVLVYGPAPDYGPEDVLVCEGLARRQLGADWRLLGVARRGSLAMRDMERKADPRLGAALILGDCREVRFVSPKKKPKKN